MVEWVTATIEPGPGQPTWCHRCYTSTAATWPIYALTVRGVAHLGEYTSCQTCDIEPDGLATWVANHPLITHRRTR